MNGDNEGIRKLHIHMCMCRKKGENMTAKKETIWVLVTYLNGDDGPVIEGVYRTKGACQKAFNLILQEVSRLFRR